MNSFVIGTAVINTDTGHAKDMEPLAVCQNSKGESLSVAAQVGRRSEAVKLGALGTRSRGWRTSDEGPGWSV